MEDGHGPETCNFNECHAQSDQPCPFLKDSKQAEPESRPKYLPGQVVQVKTPGGGDKCAVVIVDCAVRDANGTWFYWTSCGDEAWNFFEEQVEASYTMVSALWHNSHPNRGDWHPE